MIQSRHILSAFFLPLLVAGTAAVAQTSDATVPPAAAAKQSGEVASGADPARWTRNDDTRTERVATLKKEIGAAQAEALRACEAGAASARSACVAAARTRYQQDMAGADAQVDSAPGGSVTTTVTKTR